jgi:twitching motility protein PilU
MDTLTVPTLDACDFGWYLSRMVAHGASDLFLSSDTPASLKVQGEIQPLNRVPLTGAHIEKMAYSMMGRYASSKHHSNPTWPWRSRSLGAFASTCITSRIPTMASLKLPPVMQSLAMLKRGLVPIEAPLARQIHLAGLDAGRPPPDGGTPYSDD